MKPYREAKFFVRKKRVGSDPSFATHCNRILHRGTLCGQFGFRTGQKTPYSIMLERSHPRFSGSVVLHDECFGVINKHRRLGT